MDEVAAHVKADPVAYRLRHLSDPRLREWWRRRRRRRSGTRVRRRNAACGRPASRRGRGIVVRAYEGDNGYIAMVAEVDVDQDTGKVAVRRFVVRKDCGPISNPDGLRNQLEGGALQGMSRALGEEVTWDDAEGHVDRLADLSQPAARLRRSRRSRACWSIGRMTKRRAPARRRLPSSRRRSETRSSTRRG